MPRRKKCEWFVEPLDGDTNRVVFSVLRDSGAEDGMLIGVRGADGRTHNVYRVPDHQALQPLIRSRASKGLCFNVYTKRSPHGKLVKWKFE